MLTTSRPGKRILQGIGREIRELPDEEFLEAMRGLPDSMKSRLAFMSADHHAVRDFVVREMPRQSRPIPPLRIAQLTGIDLERVNRVLDDLEKHLFFLVRSSAGNVTWAFPVTTSQTPHRLTFSTGERTFGA